MDIDGALINIDVASPYGIEKLGATIDAAGILHEMLEQPELVGDRLMSRVTRLAMIGQG